MLQRHQALRLIINPCCNAQSPVPSLCFPPLQNSSFFSSFMLYISSLPVFHRHPMNMQTLSGCRAVSHSAGNHRRRSKQLAAVWISLVVTLYLTVCVSVEATKEYLIRCFTYRARSITDACTYIPVFLHHEHTPSGCRCHADKQFDKLLNAL